MIGLDKWYPFVHPSPYDVKAVAFAKAVERVEGEYREAMKANKVERKTEAYEVELYNKRARQNTLELEMYTNKRRFQIFI